MARKPISDATLKKLFSLSGNKCAFPKCKQCIVDNRKNVIGQICHIEAAEPGGQRYNPNQTDEQRRSFENLIILCPIHHKITDDVVTYPVQKLCEMKKNHEESCLNNLFSVDNKIIEKSRASLNKTKASHKESYLNSSSGHQYITKKGNIIINVSKNDDEKNLFWGIFKGIKFGFLNLDRNIVNPSTKTTAEINKNSFDSNFTWIKVNQKLDLDHKAEEVKKIIKKFTKRNANESNISPREVLQNRSKSKIDPKSKIIINQVLSNIHNSSQHDEVNIKNISNSNSQNLSQILNKFSSARSNLQIEEIKNIENQGLDFIEKEKAQIYFSSGKAYLDLLMLSKARESLIKAYEMNPNDIAVINELLRLLINLEETDLASKISDKALKQRSQIFELDLLCDLYSNVGYIYCEQGKYDKAIELYYEVNNLIKISKIENPHKISNIMLNSIFIYLVQGLHEQALNMSIETLKLLIPDFNIENPVPDSNPVINRLYNCISIVYAGRNQYDKAMKFAKIFNKSLKLMSNESYVEPYPKAISYLNLGVLNFYKGDLNNSYKYNLEAKEYIQDNIGADFSLLASAYANFGGIHLLEGDTRKATREYSKAEEILSSNQSRSNLLKTASIYCHQGNVYKMNQDYDRSRNFYEKALSILSDLFESNSPNIVNLNYNLINPQNTQNIILAF